MHSHSNRLAARRRLTSFFFFNNNFLLLLLFWGTTMGEEGLRQKTALDLLLDEQVDGDEEMMGSSSSPTAADSPMPSASPSPSMLDHQAKQIFSLSKNFELVCCMGGVPQLSHPALVRNFTFQSFSTPFFFDDSTAGSQDATGQNCRLFRGSFLLPQPSLLFGVSIELSYAAHVGCKCPEMGMGHELDPKCRRLPTCMNNGFRSLLDPHRCFCLEPFFGERCEKFCDRGRRMRARDGRDFCSCAPLYLGEECRDRLCMNGGRQSVDGTGCDCPAHFLGFHCEIDANRTQSAGGHFGVATGAGTSRFHHQRFGPDQGGEMFSRDVSGTVFSLVMIVVLVLSMYLLMKHRMQVQTRYLSSRRADLLGACNFPPPPTMAAATTANTTGAAAGGPGQARRLELLPNSVGETLSGRGFPPFVRSLAPFFASDGGPPPYAPPGQRVRRSRNEVLPPLPTYEDATKLPALRTATILVEEDEVQEQQQHVQPTTAGMAEDRGGDGGGNQTPADGQMAPAELARSAEDDQALELVELGRMVEQQRTTAVPVEAAGMDEQK